MVAWPAAPQRIGTAGHTEPARSGSQASSQGQEAQRTRSAQPRSGMPDPPTRPLAHAAAATSYPLTARRRCISQWVPGARRPAPASPSALLAVLRLPALPRQATTCDGSGRGRIFMAGMDGVGRVAPLLQPLDHNKGMLPSQRQWSVAAMCVRVLDSVHSAGASLCRPPTPVFSAASAASAAVGCAMLVVFGVHRHQRADPVAA